MKSIFVMGLLNLVLLVLPTICAAGETAADFEAGGLAALKRSQQDPDQVVTAAQLLGKAATLYDTAGESAKAVEMNSYLYWCKKKMTMEQMNMFLKSNDALVAKRLAQVEAVAVKPDDAQAFLDRAKSFAVKNPNEHMLIAIRYFEVANRFKGTDVSLQAQDLSLDAMQKSIGTAAPANAAAPAVETPAAPADTAAAQPAAPAPPAAPAAAAGPAKTPIPDAKKLTEAEATIKDVFKDEYAKTTPEDRLKLAETLARQAADTKDDAAANFQLYHEAAEMSALGGDIARTLKLLDTLAEKYEGDMAAVHKRVLALANPKDPEPRKLLTAARTLIDRPDDPTANTILGRYVCIAERNWERGLALLAKGSDAALKGMVQKEQGAAATLEGRIELADAWFELAQKETDADAKRAWHERAAVWYGAAAPEAKGLSRTKIDKRLAEISAAGRAPAKPATPPAPSKPTSSAATAAASGNPNIQPGMLKNATLNEDTTIPFTGVAYKNGGTLQTPPGDPDRRVRINVEAGVEIVGGQINLHRTGALRFNGTADKPVVIRNMIITQDLSGSLEATYTVFDKCEFRKLGGWFATYSTRWTYRSCILNKCTFLSLNQTDFGFQFHDCAIIGWKFPEVTYNSKEVDHSRVFRKEWNKIERCNIIECIVPPTIFWIAESSNFISPRFVPGTAYQSSQELTVDNYVFGSQGEVPSKATNAKVTLKPPQKPYSGFDLPKSCPIPELAGKMKVIYGQ